MLLRSSTSIDVVLDPWLATSAASLPTPPPTVTTGQGECVQTVVRAWVNRAEVDAGKHPEGEGPLTTDERDELRRLRRENNRVEMERDILRKATAFFANESA